MKASLEFNRNQGGFWELTLEAEGIERIKEGEKEIIESFAQFIEGRIDKRTISDFGRPWGTFHKFRIE